MLLEDEGAGNASGSSSRSPCCCVLLSVDRFSLGTSLRLLSAKDGEGLDDVFVMGFVGAAMRGVVPCLVCFAFVLSLLERLSMSEMLKSPASPTMSPVFFPTSLSSSARHFNQFGIDARGTRLTLGDLS